MQPVRDAFTSSLLQMATSPAEHLQAGPPWLEVYIHGSIAVIFTILLLLNIRNYFDILPYAFRAFSRARASFQLEASIPRSRSRDIAALLLVVPFCMVADYYDIYIPDMLSGLQSWTKLSVIVGIVASYWLIRKFFTWQFAPRRSGTEAYQVAAKAGNTFFLLLAFMMGFTVLLLSLFDVNHLIIRKICLALMAFIYAVFLLRKTQILSQFCNPFITILYLCALELLPTGLLVASTILL